MSILLLNRPSVVVPAPAPVLELPKAEIIVLGTPNTSGPLGTVFGGMFHGTRSGVAAYSFARGDGSEGKNTLRYVRTPGTTSYGYLIDYDGTIYELAGDQQAWHAGHGPSSHEYTDPLFRSHPRTFCAELHMNVNWIGVAFAQVDVWEPLTDAQYRSGRVLAQRLHETYRIPLVRVRPATRLAAKGWTQHMDTGQGAWNGKSDVGTWLDFERLGIAA